MENFKEHNNRKKANQFAEYITGAELRKYTAEKVKKYVGENPSVFDGAVGSGQLEQFINPSFLWGVDIQEEATQTAKNNYPNSEIQTQSFFLFHKDFQADTVVMNPPFSIKLKDLSQEEQNQIRLEFHWKKSGVVDDIFVLKSLQYTKRYGFYILFPGVGYRKTEEQFRKIIGNNLLELNKIQNAFEDTPIEVLFVVIDKQKQSNEVYKEIYDCKKKISLKEEKDFLNEEFNWRTATIEQSKEEIDINKVNEDIRNQALFFLKNTLDNQFFVVEFFNEKIDLHGWINQIKAICTTYENKLLGLKKY